MTDHASDELSFVEKIKRIGARFRFFAVGRYIERITGCTREGQPLMEPQLDIMVKSGELAENYLRALLWFGLGMGGPLEELSLFFGKFIIIRQYGNDPLVAIIKCKQDC